MSEVDTVLAEIEARIRDVNNRPVTECYIAPAYLDPNYKPAPAGGIKHDQNKPDLSMVSYELVEQISYVRAFGAKKYSRNNWKQGFKITRSCAAALRHIFQFLSGETHDTESGLCHLGHAVCALEHAIYDMKHHPENDDR